MHVEYSLNQVLNDKQLTSAEKIPDGKSKKNCNKVCIADSPVRIDIAGG